jgi:hypothetical protein
MGGALAGALVVFVVSLLLVLRARKTGGRVVVRSRVASPEAIEGALENPQVQAKLRAAGIDPEQLERDLASGKATFGDGKVHVTKTFSVATNAAVPPDFMAHAHPLPPEEALRFLHDPAFQEQLRKAGLDPEKLEHDVASGEQKLYGASSETSSGSAGPSAPPPAPQPLGPPSDDGDAVWKKGEL